MIPLRCTLAGLLLASPIYAQQQNVFLERAGVFPDAPPDKNWTIEDGKIVHKDAAGLAAFTWTKPPLEIDEEGFTLTMTIDATMNIRAGLEVSGDFITDPPQARSIDTNVETRRADPATTSVKIAPPSSCGTGNLCELRITSHAGYGVTYRYRAAR
jgi:hypothetical protein